VSTRTPQQTFPAILRRSPSEQSLRRTDGPASDTLCQVFLVCMPIFAQAMQSLTEGSPAGLLGQAPWV